MPKVQASSGVRGFAPLGSSLDLNSPLKVPIPGFFSHWRGFFEGGGGWEEHFPWGDLMPENWKKIRLSKPFSRFQLGKFFLKKLFIVKNLTDFRKMVETINLWICACHYLYKDWIES